MKKQIDIQGHRGCRGLLPENTIPAFIKALDMGIRSLELDVVITKDRVVVLSHEPWLSHEICATPDGKRIAEADEQKYNIFEMTYAELQSCDCGSWGHPRFPEQIAQKAFKPSLSALIDSVKTYCKEKKQDLPWFNIEIKREPSYDGVFAPPVAEFVDLVLKVIEAQGIEKHCNLQSFDWDVLRLCRKKAPAIPLAMLVENELSPQANLDALGFKPEIYSCYFKLIDQHLLDWIKKQEMRLIPWTVNSPEDLKRLLQMPLDGIITDYPDRALQLR